METAISGRLPLSPNPLLNIKPEKSFLYRAACANRGMLVAFSAMAPSGKGGGLLCQAVTVIERIIPKQTTYLDFSKSKKHSPPYRVLLHKDNFNRREYVVRVLLKVISGMTVDTAINIMQEAHINGLAVVIICGQADAEHHCMRLRGNGLLSSIEPASDGC